MRRETFTDTVKQAARNNWPFILQTLGIPAKFLDGKNQPCPACGGKDRFQFTLRGPGADYGRFACRGMSEQGGDGFRLVQHAFNLSFPDAVQAVAGVLGISNKISTSNAYMKLPMQKTVKVEPIIDRSTKLQRLFDSCVIITPNNQAGRYLLNRGLAWDYLPISLDSPLRHCEALDYWHTLGNKPQRLAVAPALVARVTKPNGELAGLHRIYLDKNGAKLVLYGLDRKALPVKKLQIAHDGALAGAACRLFPIGSDGRLALTEGIETALAVHRMTGLAVWACISATGLKSVVLPASVREVFIYTDNDHQDHSKNVGLLAALNAAQRFVNEGRKVNISKPPLTGMDWLDVLNHENSKGAA